MRSRIEVSLNLQYQTKLFVNNFRLEGRGRGSKIYKGKKERGDENGRKRGSSM